MKFRCFILTMVSILLFTPQLCAHGLSKKSGKTIMFDQSANFLVKIELVPDSVNFSQPNHLAVTIIDSDAAQIYKGPIKVDLSRLGDNSGKTPLSSSEFNKGLFKTKLALEQGGTFDLDLKLGNDLEDGSFNFHFELKDNIVFARSAIMISSLALILFLAIISFLLHQRRALQNRNTTIHKNGGKLRCDF